MIPGLEGEPDLLKPQTEKGQLSPQMQKDKAVHAKNTDQGGGGAGGGVREMVGFQRT